MGRRDEWEREIRRLVRAALDIGSATIDRIGTAIRERLAGDEPAPERPRPAAVGFGDEIDLAAMSKSQLYELAKQYDVVGRSRLNKDELRVAVADAMG